MKFKEFNVPAYPVDIKEWGLTFPDPSGGESIKIDKCFVRQLTVAEFAEFTSIINKLENDGKDFTLARVAIRFALADAEQGKQLFTNDDLLDILKSDARPCIRIRNKLYEVNRVNPDDVDDLKKN